MIQRTSSTRRPGGFTLVELLVVMAIIATLVGLTAAAVIKFIGGQSLKNTKLVLQKTDNALQQQWSEVVKQAKKEQPPPSVQTLAGGDATRAQVIWVKLRLRQNFPMSYAEALAPYAVNGVALLPSGDLPPIPEYVRRLNNGTLWAAKDPNTEMAACLLMALSRPRTGFKFNPDEALGGSAIKDTDGDGIPEIVDGWGRPVGFCRWGTGCVALTGLTKGTSAFDNDLQDQDRRLMDSNWNVQGSQNVATFQSLCHIIQVNNAPFSFYTIPVIVSAGADGSMGLNLPPSTSYPWDMSPVGGSSADNIFSFQVH